MSKNSDFSRYFSLKQKAYLINVSEERDRDHFESLGGTIVSCVKDTVALHVPYATGHEMGDVPGRSSYKLTSESMGHGFQIVADLIEISSDNIYHLKLRGALEMYQRRQSPRVDTSLRIFQLRRDTSLAVYRKEFKRIMDGMKTHGTRPSINLQETPVNLSAGGIRISIDSTEITCPLSMFFLDLDAAQPLVCAVAETVWVRHEKGQHVCGYRFVHISKADQERISSFVVSLMKDQGLDAPPSRVSWELSDRMHNEVAEDKP